MYDNIKLSIDVAFASEAEREKFCIRFGLCTKNEKIGIWHNKEEKNLKQNLGIYMHLNKSKLTLVFSLHKVYNYRVFGRRFNYNDFDFNDARTAYGWLTEMFNPYFDITQAIVKKYEVGINVLTPESPIEYLKELKQINVGARIIRIEEDIRYKEYQQYGTHRDKDKRVVYIFYNKTFEVRSKSKTIDRNTVPENILRLEKDNKRPFEKVLFSRLFDADFQKLIVNEFKKRFCDDLVYIETLVKPRNMKYLDFEICKKIFENGLQGVKEYYKQEYKEGRMPKRTYYRYSKKIELLSKQMPEIQISISERAKCFKRLIFNKINEVSKKDAFCVKMESPKNSKKDINENA
jgi:hypothetical protein